MPHPDVKVASSNSLVNGSALPAKLEQMQQRSTAREITRHGMCSLGIWQCPDSTRVTLPWNIVQHKLMTREKVQNIMFRNVSNGYYSFVALVVFLNH